MGVKQWLERAVGRLLRRWLRADVQVRLVIGLARLELLLQSLELEVEVVNCSTALASSPVLVQKATVDRLRVVVAFFGRRPLSLAVEGLRLVFCPRLAGDNYWRVKVEQKDLQTRRDALTKLDPKGAAKHEAAMKLFERKASTAALFGFLTDLVFTNLRLELHDASVRLVSNCNGARNFGCLLYLKTLNLLERKNRITMSSGGFLCTVFIQIVQRCWQRMPFSGKGESEKLFVAYGLCLQLESDSVSCEVGQPSIAEGLSMRGSLNSFNVSSSAAAFDGVNQNLRIEMLLFSFRYGQTHLRDLEFGIPSITVGLDTRDFEILSILITEVQGSALESMDCSLVVQQKGQIPSKRNGKELWNIAAKKAMQLTPSYRLFQVFQSGSLRQRYISLYAAWLQEVGWRIQENGGASCFQDEKKQLEDKAGKLLSSLAEMQKQLPLEAVALARTLVFHRIVTRKSEEDVPGSEASIISDANLKCLLASFIRFFWGMPNYVWKQVVFWLRCAKLSYNDNLGNRDIAIVNEDDEDRKEMTADHLQVFFAVHICQCSLTVAPTFEDKAFCKEIPPKGDLNPSWPALSLSVENFSLSKGMNYNLAHWRLICGQVTGHIMSIAPLEFENKQEEAKKSACFGKWTIREANTLTFLSSSSITENACLEKQTEGSWLNSAFKSYYWIVKGLKTKEWYGWGLKNTAQMDVLFRDHSIDPCLMQSVAPVKNSVMPFLVADFQSPDRDTCEVNSRAMPNSYMLIVGQIVFSIEPFLITNAGFFFNVYIKGIGSSIPASSLNSPGFLGQSEVATDCLNMIEMLTKKVEIFLSHWVPCSLVFLSVLFESPKLMLMLPETVLENYIQQGKLAIGDYAYGPLKAGMELMLLFGCQRLEFSTWPAYDGFGSSGLRSADDLAKFRDQEDPDQGQCLREPLAAISKGSFTPDAYSNHEQILHTMLFSIGNIEVGFKINSQTEEVLPLLSPCNVRVEASLCRDKISSLFSSCCMLSADVTLNISASSVHLYVDELSMILLVFSCYGVAFSDLCSILDGMIDGFILETDVSQFQSEESNSQPEGESTKLDKGFPNSQDRSSISVISEDFSSVLPQTCSYSFVSSISCSSLHVRMGSVRKIVDSTPQTLSGQSKTSVDLIISRKGFVNGGEPRFKTKPFAASVEGHAFVTDIKISCALRESSFPKVSTSLQRFRFYIFDPGTLTWSETQILSPLSLVHSEDRKDIFSLMEDHLEYRSDQGAVGHILSEVCLDYLTGNIMGCMKSSGVCQDEEYRGELDLQNNFNKAESVNCLEIETPYRGFCPGISSCTASSLACCSLMGERFTMTHSGSRGCGAETSCQKMKDALEVNFRIGKFFVTGGSLQRILSMISSSMPGSDSLSGHILFDKRSKNVTMGTEGGVMVLHAEALLAVLHYFQTVMQSFANLVTFLPKPVKNLLLHTAGEEKFVDRKSGIGLEASISFPSETVQRNRRKLRRVCSAPPLAQESLHTHVSVEPRWRGIFSVQMSCFRLAMFRALGPKTPEGLLVQTSMAASMESVEGKEKIAVNPLRLGICSLQGYTSCDVSSKRSDGDSNLNSQLGFMPNNKLQFSANNECHPCEESESSFAGSVPLARLSNLEDSFFDHPNSILECLKFTCLLERNYLTDSDLKWGQAWRGSCSLEGVDVAITTSEIQMILMLMDLLAESSRTDKSEHDPSSSLTSFTGIGVESHSVLPGISDGAIIALKDSREHLYISVEEIPSMNGHYHLVGVWHYSLVGDKALFKVKYQKHEKGAIWFCLLSVHAKNSDGEPFRLHLRPGSDLASIASTDDGSGELWRYVEYEHMEEEAQSVQETKVSNNLVHLVNRKSKHSLAFVDGVLMLVKLPGNPFKVKVIADYNQTEISTTRNPKEWKYLEQETADQCVIPHITCRVNTMALTVLYSVGHGTHLLPLLKIFLEDGQAIVQVGRHKARIFGENKVHLLYFEPQNSRWLPIMNPVSTDVAYRVRKVGLKKSPTSLFFKLKKVDVAINELSLDTCLFIIGALRLSGPYLLRNSPVTANHCQVENQTGVDLLCCFEHEENGGSDKVLSWQTSSFLIRHALSRRDYSIQSEASSVTLSLHKPGKGLSTGFDISLIEPRVVAVRTRVRSIEGSKMAPGPILVVDVSRKSQEGVSVSVSPIFQIHNATGLRVELRCRRPSQQGEGAIVLLEDGDKIDDCMAAFDSLDMDAEPRKALSSLSLGNFLVSVRPATSNFPSTSTNYEWSDDIKGSKAVKVSGIFDKLRYNLQRTFKIQDYSTIKTVFCAMKDATTMIQNSSDKKPGKYFIVRSFHRKVPVTKPILSKQPNSKPSVVAWQEQQEIWLLPVIRVQNFLSSSIKLVLQPHRGDKKCKSALDTLHQFENEIMVQSGGAKVCMYAEVNAVFLVVEHIDRGLVSKPLSIGSTNYQNLFSGANVKEMEMAIDFRDLVHFATLKFSRADDGVLEVIVYSKFQLENLSNIPLFCCSQVKRSRWRRQYLNTVDDFSQQSSATGGIISPHQSISWMERSTRLLLQRCEENAKAEYLDLESLSSSLEICLGVDTPDNLVDWVQLGVTLSLPSSTRSNPTHIVKFAPRYIIVNDSEETVFMCQNGFQESEAIKVLDRGESTVLHAQNLPGDISGPPSALAKSQHRSDEGRISTMGSLFTVRFCLKYRKLDWSGPVCAAALGSFYIKMRSINHGLDNGCKGSAVTSSNVSCGEQLVQFAVAEVQGEASSLVMRFRLVEPKTTPYQIQNRLKFASILFHQKGLTESDVLESGAFVPYVWDDLELPHRLVVAVTGTRLCFELNIDKLRPWKSFFAIRKANASVLSSFQEWPGSFGSLNNNTEDSYSGNSLQNVGYEVYADGPTRILRICENADCIQKRHSQLELSIPRINLEIRVSLLVISIMEPEKQRVDAPEMSSLRNYGIGYLPVICAMITGISFGAAVMPDYSLGEIKVQQLEIDVKWQGAPFAALLRIHEQDRFNTTQTIVKIACAISNRSTNPLQVKYASMLLQAIDFNLDEDTLMKLAPFYRRSLADTTKPSRQIYFDRFEIHPIKIFATFLPGLRNTDYSSTQETLRALLHSVIKVPSVKRAQIHLNGVLLLNAHLTFRQLALKCAQHYSWYIMRAIYVARGSKLLPPAFASLFDDSAASSLDVFFDPSNGSVDIQGLTLGMFHMLGRAMQNKNQGGTSRLGDLETTVRKAGSNLMFAIATEVSDNVLRGAETGGFDGMVNGFRRGILNLAMEPSVLRSAVIKGGSTRRVHLQRSAGINEAYIEGYLQGALDMMFKQEYLKVKVIEDQVVLKNLPPNSMLMEEIMNFVQGFLIGEGLLVGEPSTSVKHSIRPLDGTRERRLVPAFTALCEQLFVIFTIRVLRQQTMQLFHLQNKNMAGKPRESTSKSANQAETLEAHMSNLEANNTLVTKEHKANYKGIFGNFIISSFVAYVDGRLCRHIPNPLVRRIVSGFLLSFVE